MSTLPARAPVTPPILGLHPIRANRRGFTLIELLVVIGIVAVLAGILFSVLNKMQIASRTVKCSSNLRQIGAALLSYASDHDTALPPGPTWDQNIATYLSITSYKIPADIFTCPADPRPKPLSDGRYARSYTVNAINSLDTSIGMFSTSTTDPSRRLSTVGKEASIIMVFEYYTKADGTYVGNEQFQTPFSWTTPYLAASGAPRFADGTYYHGANECYLFADGHAAPLAPSVPCDPNNVLWRIWRK